MMFGLLLGFMCLYRLRLQSFSILSALFSMIGPLFIRRCKKNSNQGEHLCQDIKIGAPGARTPFP